MVFHDLLDMSLRFFFKSNLFLERGGSIPMKTKDDSKQKKSIKQKHSLLLFFSGFLIQQGKSNYGPSNPRSVWTSSYLNLLPFPYIFISSPTLVGEGFVLFKATSRYLGTNILPNKKNIHGKYPNLENKNMVQGI